MRWSPGPIETLRSSQRKRVHTRTSMPKHAQRGLVLMEPPERPSGHRRSRFEPESFQLWRISGESCPEGTIPVRRTTEKDILRATSVSAFGRKERRPALRAVRRDSTSNGHEGHGVIDSKPSCVDHAADPSRSSHAVGYVTGDQYYGAKAVLNVWAPRVSNANEFSLSQLWIISGSFGDDLNTIEAASLLHADVPTLIEIGRDGATHYEALVVENQANSQSFSPLARRKTARRHFGRPHHPRIVLKFCIGCFGTVSPELYGDNYPRFFTYWTTDAYQATGCYNLLCSGFVQTNNKIAIGAAISPTSTYSGGQFEISLLVWKDPNHGNWWLEFGSGLLVGYWPSFLFSHLATHASMVQFGGEIVNTQASGFHTSTEMGSGHFAEEGFGKSSYFRNLQVVDWDNNLIPVPNLKVLADHPNCYDIQGGINSVWGNYFYYGGPGRNVKCP
ncbi:hypothetical protein ACLOJK_032587 [Asimina triloba]